MAEEIFELVLNTPISHTCVSALMEAGCELNNNLTESIRVKGPHNVGDFSGRSGRSPGPLLTYLGLYICSNAPKEGFPGIRQVFFD